MAGSDDKTTELRFIWGAILLIVALFMVLSLFSYDPGDIAMLKAPPNRPPHNLIGPVGAWLSFICFMSLGAGAYAVPVWVAVFGILLVAGNTGGIRARAAWCAVFMLAFVAVLQLYGGTWTELSSRLNIADSGGIAGRMITDAVFVRLLGPVGAGILAWACVAGSLTMFAGVGNLLTGYRAVTAACRKAAVKALELGAVLAEKYRNRSTGRGSGRKRRRLERVVKGRTNRIQPHTAERAPAVEETVPGDEEPGGEETAEPAPKRKKPKRRRRETSDTAGEKSAGPQPAEASAGEVFQLPSAELLEDMESVGPRAMEADTGVTSRVLGETLAEFGIDAEVTNVERGPVVTRYEVLPAAGVRVERISALSNNLALSLKATSVRVQAPIPGKGVVGIEVPNSTANLVCLREILEGDVWMSHEAKLPLVLGKDVGGTDIVADLTEMPHMLIAGATGAGKTVCMNSILAGLLMSRTPEELRLLLVDPKIVEFSIFNDLPHLVVPVVTDPKKVALGLRWAINEMERRYKLFAKAGVRNIEGYNNRPTATQEELFEMEGGPGKTADEMPEKIPYIAIIIDELADLMLAAQAEIENSVARLAQLSRAVGIHMILSTQRPSVNVITGTIKANFPARLAFQVAQKVDSRTILDTVGAEKLLGRGDMLFQPPGTSKIIRAQGAFSTDREIKNIVEFIKAQGRPEYEMEIHQKMEKASQQPHAVDDEGEDEDLLGKAVEIIRETHRASTSSLQRRLRIGYTRAARIVDILEERGILGPPRGSEPREILIDLDGTIPDNNPAEE
ncbi:MAG: DNA translocase FtsK [Kiritimatiellia bacterium]